MDKKQAEKRIKELRKVVEYHAKKYYDEDKPEITDFEYDMMMLELRALESQFPELIEKTSLTQRVGGTVKEGFQKVEHEVPLQSLQDVFNFDEIANFDERVRKQALENGIENPKYVVETKIDGLSAALEYVDGKFIRGATRGNGLVGEDITGKRLSYTIYEKFEAEENYADYMVKDTQGAIEIALSTCTDDSKARLIILARADV